MDNEQKNLNTQSKNTEEPEQAGEEEKKKRWLRRGLNVLTAALFIAGIAMLLRQYVLLPNWGYKAPTPAPIVTSAPTPEQTAAPAQQTPDPALSPTPSPTPAPRPVPVKIYFPKEKQECPIEPVGITENNEMEAVDSAVIAGWYTYGASPGDPGNSVVNGHQRKNGQMGVFSVLKKMEPGEEIIIEYNNGALRYFESQSRETYKAEDVPEEYMTVGPDTPTRLVLITCLGDYGTDGLSESRVVVLCKELTEKRQENDPVIE